MSTRSRSGAPDLIRLDWADGAKLRGADLRTLRDAGPARLGLHVLAGHGTWGVAEGMRVQLSSDGRSANVTTGAAFNCRGTVLLQPKHVDLEAPGAGMAGREIEVVAGVPAEVKECGRFKVLEGCPPYGTHLAVAAVVRWAPVGACVDRPDGRVWRPREAEEVLLGRYRISPGGVIQTSDRPGRTIAASQGWGRAGNGSVPLDQLNWGLSFDRATAWVDTSDAGFTAKPAYTVAIEGWSVRADAMPPIVQLLDDSDDLENPGFRVGLLGVRGPGGGAVWTGIPGAGETQSARLAWTGVQSLQGCPWTFQIQLVFPVGFLIGGLILG